MSFHAKLALIVAVLLVILLTPYFLWHEAMDDYFESDAYRQWLLSARSYAWLVGIALLVGDLLLPVPSAPVIATLGAIYGPVLGGLIGAIGSVLAGLVGYGIARSLGLRATRRLADEKDLSSFQRFFDTWGLGGIIATRALPVVPEVLCFLAGLARMHFARFVIALFVGSLPISMLLAWVGASAGASSMLLLVTTAIPAGLWCAYLLWRHYQTVPA